MRVAWLLLVPLLAGCASTQVLPQGHAPDAATAPLPWSMTECRFAVAFVPVDAARIAPKMPPGFRALSFREIGAGLPDDPRGSGNIAIELWVCHDDFRTGPIYAGVFSIVEPPAALKVEGARFHIVKWDTVVLSEPIRAAAEQAGAPVKYGKGAWADWAEFSPVVGGPYFAGDAIIDGGDYQLQGSAQAPADASLANFTFVEYQPATTGFVTWDARLTASIWAGAGELDMPAGLMRDVVGVSPVQAYYLGGYAALEGNVTLPA